MGKDRKKALPLPPSDGVRRSRRNLSPPPASPQPQPCEEGSYSPPERKRPRRQEEGEPREEVSSGDSALVSVQEQVSPNKVEPQGASGDGMESSEDENGDQRSLARHHPLLIGNGINGKAHPPDQVKGGGTISEVDQGTVSRPVMRTRSAAAAAALRSEERSEENPAEEEEAHPCLFIENILDVIFKFIVKQPWPRTNVAKDIQNVRLVCKTWRTSVTRLYRQTHCEASIDSYDQRGRHPGGERKSLTQLMKTMKYSPMIPVQMFEFGEGAFSRKNLKMFREFLLICGPEVVELSLTVDSAEADRIMLNLENLPHTLEMKKLKILHIRISEDHQRQDNFEEHGPVKLLELLLIAGSTLKELTLDHESRWGAQRFRSRQQLVVQQLSLVLAKRMARTVKRLQLKAEMSEAAFNILGEMQAKLNIFGIHPPSTSGSRAMYKFLQSQADTLNNLRLAGDEYGADNMCMVEFPRLPELVKLQLPEATVSVTPPSHFADTFPKLRDVSMWMERTISTLLSTVKKPSGSLKVLDLSQRGFACSPPMIKKIAQSFPCLAKLSISLEDEKETVEEVFKYLDILESLQIKLCNFDQTANWVDSLLSGIPEADCNRLGKLGEFGAVNLNEFQRQPSLLNLKNLRELVITDPSARHQFEFTDISAHFVFLEMDSLRKIRMLNSPDQLSPKYLELLRDKLVLR